jgi:hypothetical protein
MITAINYSPLHPLRFAPLTFEIEAATDLHLPDYKGSTLRGGFGQAFKKAVCLTKTLDCPPCFMQQQCAYYSIFESKIEKKVADMLRIGRDAPHPFVLLPPLTGDNTFQQGKRLTFHLTLIGNTIEQLPFYFLAFEQLGTSIGLGRAKGRFRLVAVHDSMGTLLFDGERRKVFAPPSILSAKDLLQSPPPTDGALHLRFVTPVRIKSAYKSSSQHLIRLSTAEDFPLLVESLYHRLFTLAQLYCTSTPQPYKLKAKEFAAANVTLSHSTIRWVDWERYSNRQQARMKLGGFVGEATFNGAVEEFVPLFTLGEHLHIGKGSSFGLGKYEIT